MNQQTEQTIPPMPEGYMKSGTYTVEHFDPEGEVIGTEYGLSERTVELIVSALTARGYHDIGVHRSHIPQSTEYSLDPDAYRAMVAVTYHLNGSDFYAAADWAWTHGA